MMIFRVQFENNTIIQKFVDLIFIQVERKTVLSFLHVLISTLVFFFYAGPMRMSNSNAHTTSSGI